MIPNIFVGTVSHEWNMNRNNIVDFMLY